MSIAEIENLTVKDGGHLSHKEKVLPIYKDLNGKCQILHLFIL